MKKNIYLFFAFLSLFSCVAQSFEKKQLPSFNKWSIELFSGPAKPIRPFKEGYYTTNPDKYFSFGVINNFELGVRYMTNTKFGIKCDFGYSRFYNQYQSGSLPFETRQYRIGLQGVVNLARLFEFESFSKRIGLLAHGGIQVSRFKVVEGINEDNGGLMLGLTPQFRLSRRFVLTGDFTVINNLRQHLNWDGSYSDTGNNLNGLLYTTSIGVQYYFGKQDNHADWYLNYFNSKNSKEDHETARLDALEQMVQAIKKEQDKINLQRSQLTTQISSTTSSGEVWSTFRNNKEITIFYDINKEIPNEGSTATIYQLLTYLKANPQIKILIRGYADIRGSESLNQNLSTNRSKYLKEFLVLAGISSQRIETRGEGVDTTFPNNSQTGQELARRVTITVLNSN